MLETLLKKEEKASPGILHQNSANLSPHDKKVIDEDFKHGFDRIKHTFAFKNRKPNLVNHGLCEKITMIDQVEKHISKKLDIDDEKGQFHFNTDACRGHHNIR